MIADFFIMIINFFLMLVSTIITWFVNILPESPFKDVSLDVPSEYMGYVNYFVPLNRILPVLGICVTIIVGYKFIKMIMRFFKLG